MVKFNLTPKLKLGLIFRPDFMTDKWYCQPLIGICIYFIVVESNLSFIFQMFEWLSNHMLFYYYSQADCDARLY